MSLRVLVDMNLSPQWVPLLAREGYTAVHWSSVGDPKASDRVLMDWALTNGYVVLTHDLDFGTLLALTHQAGPSVLQIRSDDVLPAKIGTLIVQTLRTHEADLQSGALIVINENSRRVRILPI